MTTKQKTNKHQRTKSVKGTVTKGSRANVSKFKHGKGKHNFSINGPRKVKK